MSFPVGFNKNDKIYGLLFPLGYWSMSFYLTEGGRKRGYTYLRKLLGDHVAILKFELTLAEIQGRSKLIPAIPDESQKGKDIRTSRRIF